MLGGEGIAGVRTAFWWFALIAVSALSGCVGETKDMAHGHCEMELLKLPRATVDQAGFKTAFLGNCMNARGYRVVFTTDDCGLMTSPAERATCYEPTIVRNRIAQYLPVW